MSVSDKLRSAGRSAKQRLDRNTATARMAAEGYTGESLASDDRAQAGVGNQASRAVSLVVGLMVGGIVAAFLLPVAVDEIVTVDTSSWGSGASSLWDILDLIIVLAIFLFFIGAALSYS